ncbi:MAG: glycosyltransferase family 4 protein [Acidimicrobiales bacterium]
MLLQRTLRHLLVTNDFPPKAGGIQSYLWELWRRIDPSSFAVLTTSSHPDAAVFDAKQRASGMRIERVPSKFLLPTASARRRVRDAAAEIGASLVVLDPALPLGLVGGPLDLPYAVVLHGAELTVPGRLPVSRAAAKKVLRGARLLICAGRYPAAEARRLIEGRPVRLVEIPPGVDTERFRPLGESERHEARSLFGFPEDAEVVLSVSRLVPRKGMDVLIEASAALRPSFPKLIVAIGGEGRDLHRLEHLVRRSEAPVRFLGKVPDESLPLLYGAADVFVMACRDRWGGLEREGFGIVFLEAAASGVPQIAGCSGGSDEAVAHGESGLVVEDPSDPSRVASSLRRLLADADLRRRMGAAARHRAETCFDYDLLSHRLFDALEGVEGVGSVEG